MSYTNTYNRCYVFAPSRTGPSKQLAALAGINQDWRRGRRQGIPPTHSGASEDQDEQRERRAAQQLVEAVNGFDDVGVMTPKPSQQGNRNRKQVSTTGSSVKYLALTKV